MSAVTPTARRRSITSPATAATAIAKLATIRTITLANDTLPGYSPETGGSTFSIRVLTQTRSVPPSVGQTSVIEDTGR